MDNIPEFSVSSLSNAVKQSIEQGFGRVRVKGELSRVTIAKSGHMYTNLKDENAVLDAVCWRGQVAQLSLKPEEGLEVICTGRMTTYPGRSSYQLVIESMELAGEGALLKMLEERRKKLAAEGLFDMERKRALPYLPRKIGVVSSPTGAVIRDIMHRLNDRFPRHVYLWPVLVQGQNAAAQVTAAIEGFNKLDNVDLIIVARGGGSLEDLMPFNEENVVRAAAASKIPLISAVGHETDTTLIDYASDRRAPTPSAAAEIAVPRRIDLMAQVQEDGLRLGKSMDRRVQQNIQTLGHIAARIGRPERLLENVAQRLDHLATRLKSPMQYMSEQAKWLPQWQDRLDKAMVLRLDKRQTSLNSAARMLETLSFKSVLARGYAVVRDNQANVVKKAANISKDSDFVIEMQDGKVQVKSR